METAICEDCLKEKDLSQGIMHDNGIFLCHHCIQDEHYRQLEEMLNDPAHKGLSIDDIFTESWVAKATRTLKAIVNSTLDIYRQLVLIVQPHK